MPTTPPEGKIYACFVDLKKVYDSVWHDGLFAKLVSINVSGSFPKYFSEPLPKEFKCC